MALLIILLAMPIIVIVIVLLLLFNKGKTIFIQKRIGLNEKPFMAFKFKTMNDQTDLHGNLLSDEKRLTPFGKFIRRTSLDELPQLVNILKGDMSFVGPRPLLPEYLPYYNSVQRRRHQVMPGITGLAQINGRNLTSWERRFELDVQYVEQVSFVLDVKILVSTIVKVLKSEGISAKGHATMPKFSDYVKQQQN